MIGSAPVEEEFLQGLVKTVRVGLGSVCYERRPVGPGSVCYECRPEDMAHDLARKWGIELAAATNTIKATTRKEAFRNDDRRGPMA